MSPKKTCIYLAKWSSQIHKFAAAYNVIPIIIIIIIIIIIVIIIIVIIIIIIITSCNQCTARALIHRFLVLWDKNRQH